MFTTGIAHQSRFRAFPPTHIVVDVGGGGHKQLMCSGALALAETPTQKNKPCRRCVQAVREHDDADDVFNDVGWPFARFAQERV